MKLYNISTDKIENTKVVTIGDSNVIVSKVSEAELNAGGYYYIVSHSPANRRYYINTPTRELIENKYVLDYTSVQKDLADVVNLLFKDLRVTYYALLDNPKVDTTLGYYVWGGLESVEELRMWKDYAYNEIIDADEQTQSVDGNSYSTIGHAIKADRRGKYDTRKIKVAEIQAFTTVDECIYYEATPYIVNEEILDENGDGTGEFHDVSYYRNNVTDWS